MKLKKKNENDPEDNSNIYGFCLGIMPVGFSGLVVYFAEVEQ